MFNRSLEERLSLWVDLRKNLDQSHQPLEDVWEFWKDASFIPFNKSVDPYYQASWPTPWEIIAENKYDDFTKALMIAWTLKLTKKFSKSKIEIKTTVDDAKAMQYNIIYIDDYWALNYSDIGPMLVTSIPEFSFIENIIEIQVPN